MSNVSPDPAVTSKMREEWDSRARENARYYIATGKAEWSDEEFFESGRENVRREILTDMINICQGRDPKQMKVLEIGCGSGRITRALAETFGEVYAVDISGEMIAQARKALADLSNIRIFHNNGSDLSVLGEVTFDFAFTYIVFQHIPSREVIYSYVREVNRLLYPGSLFKFQVQGDATLQTDSGDTWLGVPFSDDDAVAMANACGFEPRYRHGAGEQYFWLWFFKPPA
jgi:SAM-dependent methyltransferase